MIGQKLNPDRFLPSASSAKVIRHLRHQAGVFLQVLPESLDPDSVLEGAWAETRECGEWGEPQGLEAPLAAFRHWLRHLLWELTLLLAQVDPPPLHPLSHCHTVTPALCRPTQHYSGQLLPSLRSVHKAHCLAATAPTSVEAA